MTENRKIAADTLPAKAIRVTRAFVDQSLELEREPDDFRSCFRLTDLRNKFVHQLFDLCLVGAIGFSVQEMGHFQPRADKFRFGH